MKNERFASQLSHTARDISERGNDGRRDNERYTKSKIVLTVTNDDNGI